MTRALREEMVATQIARRGVRDPLVLAAMATVPRHLFVPPDRVARAYTDAPLDIGYHQTISQPYIVAFMSEILRVEPGDRVLEVGTGSGYQAAVLAELGAEVYSVEIVDLLAERARGVLEETGYERVHLRQGDGYAGWPEAAPFAGIIVTAAPDHVPEPLQDQLAIGGRMIIPVGGRWLQRLMMIRRTGATTWAREEILPVLFVPMTGAAQDR